MRNHLVISVKERDLHEFICKLDSKGWAVMDIEPTTRVNYFSLIIGAIGIIIAGFNMMGLIPNAIAISIGIFLGIALLSTLGFSFVATYTVVCEYVGDDEFIDITPFDDTDDNFIKNENYVASEEKSEETATEETTVEEK